MSLFSSHNSSAPRPQVSDGSTTTTTTPNLTPNPAPSPVPSSSGSAPQGQPQAQVPQQNQHGQFVYTVEDVKKAVPSHIRSNITQPLVDTLNNIAADPLIAEDIRNNFVSYSAVLKEGKFKVEDYLNAVAYVSYKIMGNTNEESYAKTFPHRYSALVAKGTAKKDIASDVSAYNKGKLVNLILEQTLVPSWVLNQDLYQKAINVQADLMQNAQSEKVRAEAANSLLTHLGKPKEGSFQISIGEVESSGMREMREMLREVAENQREAIGSGRMRTIDVAAQRIKAEDE